MELNHPGNDEIKNFQDIREKTKLKTLSVNLKDKSKLKKSDLILLTTSKWDALAPFGQEKYLENYEYASIYKALRSWYTKLFSNNPELQYNNTDETRKLGSTIFKEDKKGINKPKFAFIVNRNVSADLTNHESIPLDIKVQLQKDILSDRNVNMRNKWFEEGMQHMENNLLKLFPITYRILFPLEVFEDFPKDMWRNILRRLEKMDDYFINTEVILFENKEKRTEEGDDKLTPGRKEGEANQQAKIHNIKGRKSFPVIKIEGRINDFPIRALADTGAAVSVINIEDASAAKLKIGQSNIQLHTANNATL